MLWKPRCVGELAISATCHMYRSLVHGRKPRRLDACQGPEFQVGSVSCALLGFFISTCTLVLCHTLSTPWGLAMLHLSGCGKTQIRHYVAGGAAANGCGNRPGGTGYNCGRCAAAGRGAVIRLAGMHQSVQASCNDVESIWDSAV